MTIDELIKIGYQLKLSKVHAESLAEIAMNNFGPDHSITKNSVKQVAEAEEAIKIFDDLREKLLEGGEVDAQ